MFIVFPQSFFHRALNKFLYSAISGLPDCTDLDPKSQRVLYNTHAMLMQQIEHDATPEFLEEMKSKICAGSTDQAHPSIANLAKMFNDEDLNPFNFPFEYLLNGTLPESHYFANFRNSEQGCEPKSSPEKLKVVDSNVTN